MEQHLTIIAVLAICSFVVTIGGALTTLWKAFSFLNEVKNKVDLSEFNTFKEASTATNKDQDYMIRELMRDVSEKVEKTQLELLKKDLENAIEKCATKKDLYSMKEEILKAIQQTHTNS